MFIIWVAMLTDAQIAQFRRDGFIKGSRVLTDDQVATLQAETLRVIEDRENAELPQPVLCHNFTGDPSKPVWQIVNIWQASPAFRELVFSSIVVEEVQQLTDAQQLRLWHDQIQYKPASVGGSNHWHQDSPLWPILQPKDAQVTAWVALDDVDDENGAMRMVPGSHLWGSQIPYLSSLPSFDEMPNEFAGREVVVRSCPVRKGEVHFHHSLTWHGSGRNLSGRPRRAIALHYMTGDTRYDAGGDHVMKPFVTVGDGEVLTGEAFPRVL